MPEFQDAVARLDVIQGLLMRPGSRSLEEVLEPMQRAAESIPFMKRLSPAEKKLLEQKMKVTAALLEGAGTWQQGWAERVNAWRTETQWYDARASVHDMGSGPQLAIQG